MPQSIQLLKQVRSLLTDLSNNADPSKAATALRLADMYLNELLLQEETPFYRDYLKRGNALISDGAELAQKRSGKNVEAQHQSAESANNIALTEAAIRAQQSALLAIMDNLDEGRSAEEKQFLQRVTDWENEIHKRRLQTADTGAKPEHRAITQEALQAYLTRKFPQWPNVRVTHFAPIEGGYSKKTILFEIIDDVNGPRAMVIRAEQPVNFLTFDGSDIAKEYYSITLMRQLGLPVPATQWLEEDASELGYRFLVTAKAEGRNHIEGFASITVKAPPPPEAIDSFLETFYKMHSLKIDPSDPLVQKSHLASWARLKTVRDTAVHNARECIPSIMARAGVPITPLVARALRWLEANAPDCDEPPVLVHLDYGYNNILFHENRISALLDWESSRLGDPAEDFIKTQRSLAIYDMPQFVEMYREATGRSVDAYRLAYAEVSICVMNFVLGLSALKEIETDDSSPPSLGYIAFKYVPMFGSKLSELMTEAERIRHQDQEYNSKPALKAAGGKQSIHS